MAQVDLSLPFREALVTRLRAYAPLTALVEPLEIYGEKVRADHATTFIKLGYLTAVPFQASGINGNMIPFRVNTFMHGDSSDGILKINRQVIAGLDDFQLEMDEGWNFDITFVRSTVIPDTAELSALHGLIDFEALVGVDA